MHVPCRAGGDVQEPVAQGLGFGAGECRLVVQQHRLRPGDQVGGAGGEAVPAGVLGDADAVLDAGVGTVSSAGRVFVTHGGRRRAEAAALES